MSTAQFTNYTEEEFIGYWDGKPRKFKPGQTDWMPDYLARHFAKHLTNRELLRVKKNGQPVYKDGEKMTSPKFPEQVPLYMELFNKAYTSEETGESQDNTKEDVNSMIELANKERLNKNPEKQDTKSTDDDEDSFGGKPIDNKI